MTSEFESSHNNSSWTRNLGYSIISTLYRERFIGGLTSAISMRRSILSQVLPTPFVEDWRTRGDDCLTFGGYVAGAKKFRLGPAFVGYRIHSSNFYADVVNRSPQYHYKKEVALNKLTTFFWSKLSLTNDLVYIAGLDFKTIAQFS